MRRLHLLLSLLLVSPFGGVVNGLLQPHECQCDTKGTWLDLVFLIDSSAAVNPQDFVALKNSMASFLKAIPISQSKGQYSRVAIVNVGSEAYTEGTLTTYQSSAEAYEAMRNLTHLKDPSMNMLAGLKQVNAILSNDDERKNVKNVIVIMTSNPVDCSNSQKASVLKSKLQLPVVKTEQTDPCRLAAHLRESGNTIITIAARFDGTADYPQIDIATPCFALIYDTSMAKNFVELICKANCFCPQSEVQFKEVGTCKAYGECIYLHSSSLSYEAAKQTCTDTGGYVATVFNAEKDAFLKEEMSNATYVPYWIGLNYENNEPMWDDGSPLKTGDYRNFASSQPNLQNGNCVATLTLDLKWVSAPCDDFITTYYFACQHNAYDATNYGEN